MVCEICLVCISLAFVKGDFFQGPFGLLFIFFLVITLIPSICVLIRRLHDVDKSGVSLLTLLIPILDFFASFWVFFATLRASTEGENKYGPNPLNQPDNSSASALANASAEPKLPADKRQTGDYAGREQTEEITDVDL